MVAIPELGMPAVAALLYLFRYDSHTLVFAVYQYYDWTLAGCTACTAIQTCYQAADSAKAIYIQSSVICKTLMHHAPTMV